YDKAAIRVARLCCKDGLDIGAVVNWRGDRLHSESQSGGFEWLQVNVEVGRRCRVEQEGHPRDARRNLLEQLQPLAGYRRLHNDETGDIAARPREARHEAARIGNVHKDNRNGAGLLEQRGGGGGVWRNNQVRLQGDEFLRESLHRLGIASGPASVDPDVAALRPPELL